MPRYEVYVDFQSEDQTPFADALRALRELEFDASSMEVAEHFGALVIKALELAASTFRG